MLLLIRAMHTSPNQVIFNGSGGRVRLHLTSPLRLPRLPNQTPRPTRLRRSGLARICQSVDAACCGDEANVRATTRGGNLPVAK